MPQAPRRRALLGAWALSEDQKDACHHLPQDSSGEASDIVHQVCAVDGRDLADDDD